MILTAVSLDAVNTFALEIAGLTDAKIYKATYTETAYLPGTENPNEAAFGVTDYVKCQLVRHTRTGRNDFREIHIFAPKIDILDHVGPHYRLKRTIGEQLATAYSTMVGEMFDFKDGYVCGVTKEDHDTV